VTELRIAFLMPATSPRPIGAAKVVYQYADRLAQRGHHVSVIHPIENLLESVRTRFDLDPSLLVGPDAPQDAADAQAEEVAPPSVTDPHPWYRSHPQVRNLIVPDLSEGSLSGPFDVVVGANQRVLAPMESYSDQVGLRLYFLQDYESYLLGDDEHRMSVRLSLDIPWPIIGTSHAIADLVRSATGRKCHVVPCGIDPSVFRMTVPVDSDRRTLIGFPARTEKTKRTMDAVGALELVRAQIPSRFDYWCFGYERLRAIPDWITQHVACDDAQLCELYNQSRVFIVPSEFEGFGLPGAEAMACGAALVSTRNGGVETYATDRQTAVLCQPRDLTGLASALMDFLENDDFRQRVAESGVEAMSGLSLSAAAAAFENAILIEFAAANRHQDRSS